MFYHLTLTTECNLKCKYCFGESLEDFDVGKIDYYLPKTVNFDYHTLKKFDSKDPDFVLTFYGGEPLIQIPAVKKIMDIIEAKLFMI